MRLQERKKEHLPKWLSGKNRPRTRNTPASSITRHLLLGQCDIVNAASGFRVMFRPGTCLTKQRIAEALLIKWKSPVLCVQKENVLALQLPWWKKRKLFFYWKFLLCLFFKLITSFALTFVFNYCSNCDYCSFRSKCLKENRSKGLT